jgi:hypothetical protein
MRGRSGASIVVSSAAAAVDARSILPPADGSGNP